MALRAVVDWFKAPDSEADGLLNALKRLGLIVGVATPLIALAGYTITQFGAEVDDVAAVEQLPQPAQFTTSEEDASSLAVADGDAIANETEEASENAVDPSGVVIADLQVLDDEAGGAALEIFVLNSGSSTIAITGFTLEVSDMTFAPIRGVDPAGDPPRYSYSSTPVPWPVSVGDRIEVDRPWELRGNTSEILELDLIYRSAITPTSGSDQSTPPAIEDCVTERVEVGEELKLKLELETSSGLVEWSDPIVLRRYVVGCDAE